MLHFKNVVWWTSMDGHPTPLSVEDVLIVTSEVDETEVIEDEIHNSDSAEFCALSINLFCICIFGIAYFKAKYWKSELQNENYLQP